MVDNGYRRLTVMDMGRRLAGPPAGVGTALERRVTVGIIVTTVDAEGGKTSRLSLWGTRPRSNSIHLAKKATALRTVRR